MRKAIAGHKLTLRESFGMVDNVCLNAVRGISDLVMVPGLMSITMLMAGVQGVLMPLTVDLSGSRSRPSTFVNRRPRRVAQAGSNASGSVRVDPRRITPR